MIQTNDTGRKLRVGGESHQVVTRDHLDVHSKSNRLADCLLGVRTRRVEERDDTHPEIFRRGGGAQGKR